MKFPGGAEGKPTRHLLFFVISMHAAIFTPNVAHFIGINFPEEHIISFLNESATENFDLTLDGGKLRIAFGAIASIPMLSAIGGAFFAQHTANKYGRKPTCFFGAGSCQITAGIITAIAYYTNNALIYYLGRLVYGIGFGILVAVANLYVSECTPPTQRGLIGNLASVIINICSILCYTLTLPQLFGSETRWHLLYIAVIPVSAVAVLLGFYLRETPKFDHLQKRRTSAARKTIQMYYGPDVDADKILEAFERERSQASGDVALSEILQTPHLRKGLVIAALISSTRVTSGVLLLVIYSKSIYQEQIGLSSEAANYLIIGSIVLSSIFCFWGAFQIDRYGRRVMFIGCSTIMLIFTCLFILCSQLYTELGQTWAKWPGLVSIMGVILVFSIAPNTLQFYFVTEIIPQTARAKVSTISLVTSMVLRIVYFTIFPYLQMVIGVWSLAILVVAPSIPTLLYLYYEMPETKNRAVHEVVAELMRKTGSKVISKGAADPLALPLVDENGVKDADNDKSKEVV